MRYQILHGKEAKKTLWSKSSTSAKHQGWKWDTHQVVGKLWDKGVCTAHSQGSGLPPLKAGFISASCTGTQGRYERTFRYVITVQAENQTCLWMNTFSSWRSQWEHAAWQAVLRETEPLLESSTVSCPPVLLLAKICLGIENTGKIQFKEKWSG